MGQFYSLQRKLDFRCFVDIKHNQQNISTLVTKFANNVVITFYWQISHTDYGSECSDPNDTVRWEIHLPNNIRTCFIWPSTLRLTSGQIGTVDLKLLYIRCVRSNYKHTGVSRLSWCMCEGIRYSFNVKTNHCVIACSNILQNITKHLHKILGKYKIMQKS